jgi:hypothetical protein
VEREVACGEYDSVDMSECGMEERGDGVGAGEDPERLSAGSEDDMLRRTKARLSSRSRPVLSRHLYRSVKDSAYLESGKLTHSELRSSHYSQE